MAINQLELTNKLIACPSMSSAGSRAGVVRALPDYIQHSITLGVTSSGTQEVLSIVQTCMKFPNGLDNLIDVVRFFDKGTYPFIALEEYMRQAQLESPIAPPVTNQPTTGNYSSSAPNAASDKPKLSVFLAYADADVTQVEQLYDRLVGDGFTPWMAERDILGGGNIGLENQKALEQADVILVCLSKAVNQPGALNKQIKLAIDQYSYQPEGSIFLIPVKLESLTANDIPYELRKLRALDYFQPNSYTLLFKTLQKRAGDLGKFQPGAPGATPNTDTTVSTPPVNQSNLTNTTETGSGNQADSNVSAAQTQTVGASAEPQPLSRSDKNGLAKLLQRTNAFVIDPRGFLRGANVPQGVISQINFQGGDEVISNAVIQELINYGRLKNAPYQPALGAFIEYLLERDYGQADTKFLQELLTRYDQISFPDAQSRSSLEAMVAGKQDQRWKSADFFIRGAKSLRAVCRVETDQTVLGTGFLVAPDLVLTNHHVLVSGTGNTDAQKAQTLRFRFGYLREEGQIREGEMVSPIATEKALVTSSTFTPPGLDFALIRLNGAPGDKFGWLTLDSRGLVLNEELIILQHPSGWDMQFMTGQMKNYDPNASRMKHDAGTLKGSSGSPVFDSDWKVVALHCAGDATANQAVPMSLIYPKIAEYLPK
jgi:V8-like Glu-specific endopeptidase